MKLKQTELRVSSLLWAVIVFQLILWLSEYWLPETVTATSYSLLAVFVVQVVIPHHWGKYMLQLAAVLLVNLLLFWDADALTSTSHAVENGLLQTWINMHPYILYSLVTTLVFVVMTVWAVTKQRVSYIVLTIIVALCVVDSFSLVIVWNNIATIVVCGLLLIAVLHFAKFKRKYPASWTHLKERPGSILFPLITLLSLMLFVGMQAPTLTPLLTDPYTAWKNAQGEAVEQFGKGLDSSRLSSSSGYGRNDSSLGGSFLYDHSPVMTVETTKRAYWRGESLDYYDGSGWGKSEYIRSRRSGQTFSSSIQISSIWDQSKLKTETVHYSVTMLTDTHYPVLFAAYLPERLELVNSSTIFPRGIGWDSLQHELSWMRLQDRDYPASYSLLSQIPVLDEEGLRTAYNDWSPEIEVENIYLELPDDLPERVHGLAREVAADAVSVYDQVRNVETYLKNEFAYTNTPDESHASSHDFVDRFLFEVREGYCDYFSTAMIVMLRSLDIPARWVKGFSPGQSDALANWDDYEGPPNAEQWNGPGTYTVRNSNAHSWVEVYFPGYGWIPFEPTPGFTLTHGTENDQEASAPLPQVPMDKERPDVTETAADKGQTFARWGVWLALGIGSLFVLAFVAYLLTRRTHSVRRLKNVFKKNSLNETVIARVDRFLAFAAKKGMPRADHETMREWTNHWSGKYRWLSEKLQQLLILFERAKYTPSRLTKEETEHTKQLIAELRRQITAARHQSKL